MTNTQTTKTATGYRGRGTAVHIIFVPEVGAPYALCFASPNMTHARNYQRVTLAPEGTPVTCRSCDPAASEKLPTEHPETCADHPRSTIWRDAQLKAGHKRTWTCGDSHLIKTAR